MEQAEREVREQLFPSYLQDFLRQRSLEQQGRGQAEGQGQEGLGEQGEQGEQQGRQRGQEQADHEEQWQPGAQQEPYPQQLGQQQQQPELLLRRKARSTSPLGLRPVVHMYQQGEGPAAAPAADDGWSSSSRASASGRAAAGGHLEPRPSQRLSEYRQQLSSRQDSPVMHIEARHRQVEERVRDMVDGVLQAQGLREGYRFVEQ